MCKLKCLGPWAVLLANGGKKGGLCLAENSKVDEGTGETHLNQCDQEVHDGDSDGDGGVPCFDH